MKLYKGNIVVTGCKSPYSLLNKKIATYGEKNGFLDGKEARGFWKIHSCKAY